MDAKILVVVAALCLFGSLAAEEQELTVLFLREEMILNPGSVKSLTVIPSLKYKGTPVEFELTLKEAKDICLSSGDNNSNIACGNGSVCSNTCTLQSEESKEGGVKEIVLTVTYSSGNTNIVHSDKFYTIEVKVTPDIKLARVASFSLIARDGRSKCEDGMGG